jgi:eukaryotic-like serine/threonine-protein kinase
MDTLILGRYRLVERLASGGSAEVWRAHDVQLDRAVAVKRPHPHLIADDLSRSRLVAEARAAAQLSHPVIVGVYDVDPDGEAPVIVMELVEGESLAARIAGSGPVSAREAAALAADVADALYHAHQRGVVHRDVKPGNVLLAADGGTRLVDFGIARILAESAARLTLTGTVVGTLNAMAPEQLAGGEIGPRTDLYGLGVVLHEALTGRPPYAATSPVALAEAQRAGPGPIDAVDPALAALTRACLAHDPAGRPVHAGAVAAALRAWLEGDPAPAFALGVAATAADTSAITQTAPAPPVSTHDRRASAGHRARRLHPLIPVLATAAAAVAVALAIVLASPGDGSIGGATTQPEPEPTPLPTAIPEWMAKLIEDLRKHCPPETVATATTQLAVLSEEPGKEYAEDVRKACEDAGGGGDGNGGRGRGNDD